jgi:hypothetical protein
LGKGKPHLVRSPFGPLTSWSPPHYLRSALFRTIFSNFGKRIHCSPCFPICEKLLPTRREEGSLPSQARHPAHHRKDGSCPVIGQSLATAQEGTPLGDGHSSFIVNALLRRGYRLVERGVPFRRRVRVEGVQAPQRLRMVLEPDPLQLPLT